MRTPASVAGHPIHPMLVTIPIGLWIFSLACDLIHVGGGATAWTTVALFTMGGGIVGALAAALFGSIDMLSLPPGPRKTALAHMAINLAVVALYAVNFALRLRAETSEPGKLIWLSVIAIALLGMSGWLGGKLVYEHGIGVDTKALQ